MALTFEEWLDACPDDDIETNRERARRVLGPRYGPWLREAWRLGMAQVEASDCYKAGAPNEEPTMKRVHEDRYVYKPRWGMASPIKHEPIPHLDNPYFTLSLIPYTHVEGETFTHMWKSALIRHNPDGSSNMFLGFGMTPEEAVNFLATFFTMDAPYVP